MKDILQNLLQNLPKLLEILPSIIKYIPWILIVLGIGYGAYLLYSDTPPLYVCYNNQMYELQLFSKVYVYKGDVCIQM